MSKRAQGVVAGWFVLLVCGATLAAQDVATGALRGVVEDPAGARLPQARVTLTHLARGATHTAVADTSGMFLFPVLAPGVYGIQVEAAGMAPLRQNVRLEAGDTLELTL